MTKQDPFRPVDDEVRALARKLIEAATFAALAVAGPSVSRIGFATDVTGVPITLISSLSGHYNALQSDPNCALLIGEPEGKGDPLTHPRLTVHARAQFIDANGADHRVVRSRYLTIRPKAKLYVDFGDFCFVRFQIKNALLNGGFGQAYKLTASDL